jgi:TRIAD3 protein (E3 ubiquitin-protein ligase RNF216)
VAEEAEDDTGDGFECGCCFSNYPFVCFSLFHLCMTVLMTNLLQHKMIQCPDAHLFCSACMTTYASGLLGAHNVNIVCMDQSGCKLAFPLSELQRFLTPKLMELYHRVQQMKEIEAAGLENLEECPFCEYKVVIENEHEKLFRCENSDCGAVTCRGCKKLVSDSSQPEASNADAYIQDHLPKSCKGQFAFSDRTL